MNAKRAGAVLFGVGLLLAPLSAEFGGQTCTAADPAAPLSIGFGGLDPAAGALALELGGRTCVVAWPVTLGLAFLVVGAAASGVGVGREMLGQR